MSEYDAFMAEDARLVILKELAKQTSASLNDNVLLKVLETFGHNRSRDWVRTQMRKLEELGAVSLVEAGTSLIARLRQAGSMIEGVARPSLEA